MDLSIIIVSWKVKDKLKENLTALFNSQSDFSFEVFLVDNHSQDGTVEMVRSYFSQVKLIANDKNLGFARASNQAIRYATGRYLLLLNPDIKVFPETLANMLGWMDNHLEASVAGCRLIDQQGRIIKQVRAFPTVWDQLAIVLKVPHLFPAILNKYIRVDFDYSQAAPIDSIRGSFFMIRRETIEKVGLLDEQFFLWFEEVDYCQRVSQVGGQVWYTPVAECLDYLGQSFKQVSRGQAQKYFRESQLKYIKKWQPAWQYWLLDLAWPFGQAITWVGSLFNLKSRIKT